MTKPHNVTSLAAWADGHEVLCDERHGTIKTRLSRIECILLSAVATIILGGATVLWQIVQISLKLGH